MNRLSNLNTDLNNLDIHLPVYLLLVLHCLMGLLAAIVAQRRGFSFNRWLILGLIGGTVAFAIVLFKQPQSEP